MKYLANKDFDYAIKNVVSHFKKDEEVKVPASEVSYMIEQKFIREVKEGQPATNNRKSKEELENVIAGIKTKMSKEMDAAKLEKLDKQKAKFEEELAKLED